ncbi:MAG: HU family DNA-binding protein [Lachnospiraceae bacterium]|nr:HU family DNA-binding protein [Lachnospiraceae bacterium]
MNKKELVSAVAEASGVSKKDTEAVISAFTEVVGDAMKSGDKVQLVGFGTFEVSRRAARVGRNPATGETMQIEASSVPKFKAGNALKEKVNA